MKPDAARFRRLIGPIYFILALLIALPIVDLGANIWPWAPGSVEWRFGAFGLLSGFLLTPVLGAVLVVMVAVTLGHRRLGRFLGIIAGLTAVALVVVSAVYALDVLQVRASVPQAGLRRFEIGAAKAVFKNGLMALSLGWLGWSAWRSTAARGARDHDAADSAPLLMRS